MAVAVNATARSRRAGRRRRTLADAEWVLGGKGAILFSGGAASIAALSLGWYGWTAPKITSPEFSSQRSRRPPGTRQQH